MGLIRKMTSLGTAGLVDLRSDKERIARNTAKTNKTMKVQNKLLKEQNRLVASAAKQPSYQNRVVSSAAKQPSYQLVGEAAQAAQASPQPVAPQGPPAGWYADAEQPGMDRWYDGVAWTDFRQPKA
jgi:hypothetical protein